MNQNLARAPLFSATALAALLLAGCAQALRPAPEAQRVPGRELAAVTESAGVSMVVEAGAWNGRPDNLERELTPLRVTLQNGSGRPVRVRYDDFAIDTGRGITYAPLPPIDIRGTVTERADRPVHVPRHAIRPRFAYSGFYVAPWYMPHYVGMRPWRRAWAYDPFYYDTYYPRWTVKLPTADMLEMAIPEGVIEPGGSVTGFLYFPEIGGEAERLMFRAELMDGQDGQRVGALEVPFERG
jgi:hypothetical protein